MKELILVRHAKSSWDNPLDSDHDRPLNERGERDAPRVAEWLHTQIPNIDAILSSTALRAVTTAQVFAKSYGMEQTGVLTTRDLYHATVESFFDVLAWMVPAAATRVMVVGHNPTLSYVIGRLLGTAVDVPTCAVTVIRFPDAHDWKQLFDAELVLSITPKQL